MFPYAGSYRTAAGGTMVVTLQGWLIDLGSGSVSALSETGDPALFLLSPGFGGTPADGTVRFTAASAGAGDRLEQDGEGGGRVSATRLPVTRHDVRIQSGDASLAGTVVEPAVPGPRPGVVITHGSGRQVRQDADLFTNLFASLGFTVLTYDKRGTGDSGGAYPGERATDGNLNAYAADLVAVTRYLRGVPGVAGSRVGVYGGSQAGWVIPLAAQELPWLGFAVVAVGPAVTVSQQELYATMSGNGAFVPAASDDQIDADVRAAIGGFDPTPSLRRLTAPALWLLGGRDLHVPTRVSAANLAALRRPNLTVHVSPEADHALLATAHGLDAEDAMATRFAPDALAAIEAWVRDVGLVR
ncbi:MAG TPA: alpha/beta hydrolase [Candidatus Dormibacteraeota bacterium]